MSRALIVAGGSRGLGAAICIGAARLGALMDEIRSDIVKRNATILLGLA